MKLHMGEKKDEIKIWIAGLGTYIQVSKETYCGYTSP